MKPHVLQGLPAHEMIYVEVAPGGGRRIFNVDFDPQIASLPRVSTRPFTIGY